MKKRPMIFIFSIIFMLSTCALFIKEDEKELVGVYYEPCEKVYSACNVVVEENIVEVFDENDSVDTLNDYMQYYIFKPGVFDEEGERKENKSEKRTLTEIKRSDTMDEIDMLYRIVWHESRNQGDDGMRRVCDVVLNRVEDPRFPNNIKDVILAPGQFTTASKLYSVEYDEETINAVNKELAVSRENRLDKESIYFARSPLTKDYYKAGDHYFAK